MDVIKSTMYNIALISIISGMVDMFSSTSKYKKYISFIASVIIILSIIIPIKNLSSFYLDKNIEYRFNEQENNREANIQQTLEQAVLNNISDYFALPQDAFTVEIHLENKEDNLLIKSIEILITDSRYFNQAERINAYVKSNYGCITEVIQDFKEK